MLEFVTKQVARDYWKNDGSDFYVAVKQRKSQKTKNRDSYVISFTFYNNGADQISRSNYLVFAIDDDRNRIYFKESDDKDGYKISCHDSKNTATKIVQATYNNLPSCFVNQHFKLKFDEVYKLYFIESKGLEFHTK